MFVRTVDFFDFFCVCLLINTLNIFGCFYIMSYLRDGQSYLLLTSITFVYCLKKETFLKHITVKKAVLILSHLFIKSINW